MNKRALRQEIRRRISQLSDAERATESAQICRRVLDSPGWCEASCVLLYYPMADEVDVRPLLTAALQDGKRVLFPVVQGDGYYDRLLPQLSAHRLAVCFPCQIVDNLPYEPHDAQMDEVVY